MITEHGSFVNTKLICDIRHQLVSCHVFILFFQTKVVPCHVCSVIQVSGIHIGIFQTKSWKVIAVHNNDCFLITFG